MVAEYTVSLHDTVFFQMGVHTVVKNAPFVIHVVPQSNANKDKDKEKEKVSTPPPSVSSLKLIYSSPPVREVAVRNSSPIEFTEHQATNKDGVPFLAVEVRLFVLSSQHEGESFKVVVTLEGGCELTTESIKCVSKQAKVVTRSPTITPSQNGGSVSTHNNHNHNNSNSNNNNNNDNNHHTPSQTSTQRGSPSRSPTASTQTHATTHFSSSSSSSHSHSQIHTRTHTQQQQQQQSPATKKRDIVTTRKRAREAENNEKALKRIASEQQTQRVLLELLFKQTQYIMACIAPTLTPPSSSSPNNSHNNPAFENSLTGELAFSEMVFDSPKFFSAPLTSSVGNPTTLVNITDYSEQSQQQQHQQQQSQQRQQQGEEQHGHGVNSAEIADYGKTDNECDINREGSSSPCSSPYSSFGDYLGDIV